MKAINFIIILLVLGCFAAIIYLLYTATVGSTPGGKTTYPAGSILYTDPTDDAALAKWGITHTPYPMPVYMYTDAQGTLHQGTAQEMINQKFFTP